MARVQKQTSRSGWSKVQSRAARRAEMQQYLARAVRKCEGHVQALRKYGRAITDLQFHAALHGAAPGASLHQLRQQNNTAIVLEETHLQTIRHMPSALIAAFAVADHTDDSRALFVAQQGESRRMRADAARATAMAIAARNRRAAMRHARAAMPAQNDAGLLLKATPARQIYDEEEVIEDGLLL